MGSRSHVRLEPSRAQGGMFLRTSEATIDFTEEIGGCSRIRTYDPLIKSQLLYQLSYAPKPVAP